MVFKHLLCENGFEREGGRGGQADRERRVRSDEMYIEIRLTRHNRETIDSRQLAEHIESLS